MAYTQSKVRVTVGGRYSSKSYTELHLVPTENAVCLQFKTNRLMTFRVITIAIHYDSRVNTCKSCRFSVQFWKVTVGGTVLYSIRV